MGNQSKVVREGWLGPGRRDGHIEPLKPEDDGLHIQVGGRGMYEWWYFDAHLESGHTLVVFFHAANPNPGRQGKIGIEIVLVDPQGVRQEKFYTYGRQDFAAARDHAEVAIGANTLRVTTGENGLPRYEIQVVEKELGCRLAYQAQVQGWKPGTGLSHFGDLGYFGWVVPFARAAVEGTVTAGGETFQVSGTGYHDHNWLNFPFQQIIEYWMWGRVYSESYTVSYAFIQCNEKVARHTVQVLMLAHGQQVVLSTGEYDFAKTDFEYNPKAKHHYPRQVTITVPGEMTLTLKVKKILEAQDMLLNFHPLLRLLARYLLRLQPGYFRLVSDFELQVGQGADAARERGTTLHEIVIFKEVE